MDATEQAGPADTARPDDTSTTRMGQAIRAVYRAMSPVRRRQFYLSLLMMLLGALAELMTIGAVLPFMALLSDPTRAERIPAIGLTLRLIGWAPGKDLVFSATLLLVAMAALGGAIRLLLTWISQSFVFQLGHDLGVAIYDRVLHQPYSFHIRRNSSEVLSGIERVQDVIYGLLLPVMLGITSAVMAALIIALLFFIDPFTAAIAALAMGAIYVLVSLASRRILSRNSTIVSSAATARVKQVQEGLGGIRDVLIDQAQPVFRDKFARLDGALRTAQATNVFLTMAPRFIVESTGIVIIALLAFYLSGKPGGVIAAIPVLGALALGAQRLLPLLQLAYVGWSQFAGNSRILVDVVALMEAPLSEDGLQLAPRALPPLADSIAIDNVSFRYADGRTALRDISFKIGRGQRVGFVGKTGSGKTTLMDLLMGLLTPTAGGIRIDGAPLDASTRAAWQSQIAHVPQAIYLSDSSIAENIAFGQHHVAIDLDRVRAAARRAQIDQFIESLPDGYETLVGERGVRISGGQRQRIGIARALYKRAGILILDEATSALDDQTEQAVMNAIGGEDRDYTVLMIAHRLSTLADCDLVVRLDEGQLIATGTYDEIVGSMPSPDKLAKVG